VTAEIHSILQERGLVSAAKVAVLNLEAVKVYLGPKWDKLATLVCAFFEAAIRQTFKPGDAFFKSGELGYILIYRDLSVEEAQQKCAELSRDVCRKLFGAEGIEFAVRNVVGQVDGSLLKNLHNVTAAIDQSLEQHGRETVIFTDRGLPPPEAEMAPETAPLKLNFTQHRERSFACSESRLSFAYRPIWDCVSRVILTYLCQPIPAQGVDTALLSTTGFCSVSTGDADCALLDRTILTHCAKRIDTLRKDGVRLLLGVPLHFSTLSRPRPWKIFNDLYSQIPPVLLRELVFVIFGLEGVPNVRLVQEMSKLATTRHVFCVTEPDNTVAARFAYVRAHAVGLELPRTRGRERQVLESVKSLAGGARKNGHESFLLGVTNTSRAVNAMAAGVRYLEGPAIHPVVADPRCAFIHELEDLYATRTA